MVFDVGWLDLFSGLGLSVASSNRPERRAEVERVFSAQPERNLAFLSVRSGFSATLQALALPQGSRIAFSGITIKDMPRIAQHHGLQVDAFDVDPATLQPSVQSLERVLTPDTRVIVLAHLFGSRADLTPFHDLAERRGLTVVEDCAQAYTGDGWCGHERSDVACFSFGPIKTATALGGAVLRYRDPKLRQRAAAVQDAWPVQSQARFARRVLRFFGLQFLSVRPVFSAFTSGCDALGKNWDALIAQSARGFSGGDFFQRIHMQPCAALLALLQRRLTQPHGVRIAQRAAVAQRLRAAIGGEASPGVNAQFHSHWVVPVSFNQPEHAAAVLRSHGFDATRGTSSMTVVGSLPEQQAPQARSAEGQWLYVPCHAQMSHSDRERLIRAVHAARAPAEPPKLPADAPNLPADRGEHRDAGHTLSTHHT